MRLFPLPEPCVIFLQADRHKKQAVHGKELINEPACLTQELK